MTGIIDYIVVALIDYGLGAEAATWIATAAVYGAEALALNALSQKPRLPSYLSEQQDRQHVIRSAIAPHRIVLGECVSSGPLIGAFALDGPTGKKNELLYMVVALAGHEVDNIGTVYLNDVPSTDVKFGGTKVDIQLSGPYYENATTGTITATIDGIIFTLAVGGVGNGALVNDYEADHTPPLMRGWSIANQTNAANLVAQIQAAAIYATANYTVAQGEGLFTDCAGNSTDGEFTGVVEIRSKTGTPVIVTVAAEGDHGIAACMHTVSTSQDYLKINKHFGVTDQVVDADLLVDGAPFVTTYHRAREIAYLVLKLTWDREVWATGIPQVKAVVRGVKLFDPRTSITAWSDNPVLAAYLLLTNTRGMRVPTARIDTANFSAAATLCDELVDARSAVGLGVSEVGVLQAAGGYRSKVNAPSHGLRSGHLVTISGHGGTPSLDAIWTIAVDHADYFWVTANVTVPGSGGTAQAKVKRYTCNGSFTVDEKPRDIMSAVLSSMGGRLTYWGGKYRIHPAAYDTPTITLTDSDLRGVVRGQIRSARRDLINGVRGTYVDPDKRWQATDYPIYKSATYKTQDNEEEILGDLNLPFTTDPYIAQRLAKLELERNRRGRTIEFPAKFTKLNVRVWDTVTVNLVNPSGWNGVYRVVNLKLNAAEGLDLTLREEHSAVYAWSGSDATPTHVPGASAPLPIDVPAPPTDLAYTILSFDITACVRLTATAPKDAFVHAYDLEYQVAGETTWHAVPSDLETEIDVTAPGIGVTVCGVPADDYVVRVRSVGDNGKKSIWATLNIHVAPPDLSPMPNVTGLELCGQGNNTVFTSRDPKFCWRDASTYNNTPMASTTASADAGGTDYAFRDYELKFYDEADVLVYTAYVIPPEVFVPYDQNAMEYARLHNGTPGAYRVYTLEVRARGMQGQRSATPARLTVSNPPPALPTNISVVAGAASTDASFTPPGDVDWTGTLIWASTVSGFTPTGTALGEGNVVYDGPDTVLRFPGLTPGETYYYRVASYDAYGKSGLTISPEYSVSLGLNDPADTVPPVTPTGITTSTALVQNAQTDTAYIQVAWTANTEADLAYYILRGRRQGQTVWTEFNVAAPAANYRYEFAVPGVTYEGQLAAVDRNGNMSAFSSTFTRTAALDANAPATPTGLTVTAGIKSITVKITANTEADLAGYELHVSTTNGFTPGSGSLVGQGNVTQHVYQANVAVNTTYYVKVRAFDYSGNYSGYTSQGSATAYPVATGYIEDDAVTSSKRQQANSSSTSYTAIAGVYGGGQITHNLGRIPVCTVYSDRVSVAFWPSAVSTTTFDFGWYCFATVDQSGTVTIYYI